MRDQSKLHNLDSRLRAKQQGDDARFEPRIVRVVGTVHEVDGSIYAPGYGNGVVHVIEWASVSGYALAKTNGIGVEDGVMVWMTKDVTEGIYTIERLYEGILQPQYYSQASAYNIGKHAPRHQWPTEANKGDDAVSIYEPAIMPGKVDPYSLLTVSVQRFTYYRGNSVTLYPDSIFDLTSYMPASGNQKFVLLYMDPYDGTLNAKSGTETIYTPVIIPSEPDVVPGTYPLALILLTDGTTTLPADHIFTARSILSPVDTEIGELFMSSAGGWPSLTNGCAVNVKNETATNKQSYWSLDFDQSSTEYAEWTVLMPHDWDGGVVAARFVWTATSGSGNVAWGLQGVAYNNGDALDAVWGDGQVAVGLLTGTEEDQVTGLTNAITIAGFPLPNSLVQFRVYRDTSVGNNLAADAMLLAVKLYFTKTNIQVINLADLPEGQKKLGYVSADAYLKAVELGSVSADAAIESTASSSITVDAIIGVSESDSVTADSAIEATESDSVTANATVETSESSSISADADIT